MRRILILLSTLILFACQSAPNLDAAPPTREPSTTVLTPGELVLEVGLQTELPSNLRWYDVPAQWEYQVGGDTVIATVTWEDDNTVNLDVTNHSLNPEFQESSSVKDSWVLTNTVTAKEWLTDKSTQYAMFGFKDEIHVYLRFEGENYDTLKVAFLSFRDK